MSLAVLFDTLHLLQPVEPEKDFHEIHVNPSEEEGVYPFTETAFCQVHTPAKLGEDRQRFLHLVHDIQNRKDNYVEQLSYLSLASLSERSGQGEQQRHSIISSLLQGGTPKAAGAGTGQDQEALWQARLVLKLAEQLDREEEELACQLAMIDDSEIALFRTLQGELQESGEGDGGVDPFQELLELRQKMNLPRPGMMKNRLRAWSRLYLSGALPLSLAVWTTRRLEAAEILFDQYEKEREQTPVHLLRLELPVRFDGEPQQEQQKVAAFRALTQPGRQEFAARIIGLMNRATEEGEGPTELVPWAATWEEQWKEQLESAFPACEYGRLALNLYLLPGLSLPSLIGGKGECRNGLLAVCT